MLEQYSCGRLDTLYIEGELQTMKMSFSNVSVEMVKGCIASGTLPLKRTTRNAPEGLDCSIDGLGFQIFDTKKILSLGLPRNFFVISDR